MNLMKKIVWFLTAVVAGVYITRPIADPDLWWHLVVGRWILAHGQVPVVDHWTRFAAGTPWRAYSWSNEVVYALFERVAGLNGVLFLHLLLAALLALSFSYCFGRIARDWFVGTLIALVVTAACVEHFSLRPQTFTWVLLVWLLYVAERIYERGLRRTDAAAAALIMCLWANSQITTVLGIAALVAWSFNPARPGDAVRAGIVGLLGTLCTPYLGGEWLTFFSKADHPMSFPGIREFGPASILHFSTGFTVLLLCLLIALWQRLPRAVPVMRGALAAAFLCGGFAVVKFLPDAAIVLGALLAVVWAQSRQGEIGLGSYGEAIERLRLLFDRVNGQGFAFLLICLIVVYAQRTMAGGINREAMPVDAVAYIQTHQLPAPLLNTFNDGGYVMHAFSRPDGTLENPVTIDGRTNLISKELWQDYSDAIAGAEGWHDLIEKVRPNTILWSNESPLPALLRAEGGWCRVFRSGKARQGRSVFVATERATAMGLECQ